VDPVERLRDRELIGADPGRKDVYTAVRMRPFQSLDQFADDYLNHPDRQTIHHASTRSYHRALNHIQTPYTHRVARYFRSKRAQKS
jgi:hypothetical protein